MQDTAHWCGWQGGWGHCGDGFSELGWAGRPAPSRRLKSGRKVGLDCGRRRKVNRLDHLNERLPLLTAVLTQPAYSRPGHSSILGRVVILRFTAVRRTFSSLRCPYNRHSGASRNPASYIPGYGNGAGRHRFRLSPDSGVVISSYCNGAGKHRFRFAPE